MSPHDTISNRPFDSLKPGDSAKIERRISVGDMRGFTTHAADIMGQGIDRELAADPDFRAALAQGGVAVTLLVTLDVSRFSRPRARGLIRLSLEFAGRLMQGDLRFGKVTVCRARCRIAQGAGLDCCCHREDGHGSSEGPDRRHMRRIKQVVRAP